MVKFFTFCDGVMSASPPLLGRGPGGGVKSTTINPPVKSTPSGTRLRDGRC